MLTRFRRNPLQAAILWVVMAAHLVFILALWVSPHLTPRKKEHKPLVVTTITPKPVAIKPVTPKKAPSSSPTPHAPPIPKPEVKKETAPPKPTPPPPQKEKVVAPAKKPAPKPVPEIKKEPAIADKKITPIKQPPKKPAPQQQRAKISDSLLRELEESIAKIDGKGDKSPIKRSASAAAKAVAPIQLQIDALEAAEEESGEDDADALIAHLHRHLELPDYGEVKIQLSLRQDGSVARVVVLKSQSEKNRQYLVSTLLRPGFPRFEGKTLNKNEHTFILTFCNEL